MKSASPTEIGAHQLEVLRELFHPVLKALERRAWWFVLPLQGGPGRLLEREQPLLNLIRLLAQAIEVRRKLVHQHRRV